MGQYWIPVNLNKREFIMPPKLGNGLKLWEQFASHPGTGAALIALCAAMPEKRGGGDIDLREVDEEVVVGRWAGDRIALVGDYAGRDDLPAEFNADLIYSLCGSPEEVASRIEWCRKEGANPKRGAELRRYQIDKANRMEKETPYRDISELVCKVIEKELCGEYTGDGWRNFKQSGR